jgi:hypothetical protein
MNIYEGGAKRGGKLPRFRDIDYHFLERLGKALLEGAEKYEKDLPVWEKNWRKGKDEFFFDAIDHAIDHLFRFKEEMMRRYGQDSLSLEPEESGEDHIGHCAANLLMLSYWEKKRKQEPEEPEKSEVRTNPILKALGIR